MDGITNGTLAFYRRAALQMGTLRRDAEELQNQLSTGQRISRSSDDPVAASRLRLLARADRLGEIDTANAQRTAENMQLAAGALESIGEDLIRARELALWASSDTIGERERAAIGEEVEQLRLRIMSSANARDASGNALFGGEASGKAYEIDGAGVITYVGTALSGEIDLGQGQTITRGITGPEVLTYTSNGASTDAFVVLEGLAAALQGTGGDPITVARDAMSSLDDAVESLTRAQTLTGSRLAWIDVVQNRQTDEALTRAQQTADTGGVPFAETVAELQQMLTTLEASQAGFARLSALTLFDSI